jgi:4-hydroxy-3-polyprenylbenzoate decarboxylase
MARKRYIQTSNKNQFTVPTNFAYVRSPHHFVSSSLMKKIAVAITGASGSLYAKIFLQKLGKLNEQIQELSIVMTDNAWQVWQTELGDESHRDFPARYFTTKDFTAPFASGSARYDALIIIPCSMGTLGRIAAGISNDLITRAADVMLKERKKLICVIRDTPYNLIHIRNMEAVTLAGGIICPASPSFYSRPKNLEDAAATVVDRVIDLAGLSNASFRWGEEKDDR